MTEAEIIAHLIEFQNVLLLGVSIFITIVSAYIVALYAFLDEAGLALKFFAYIFLIITLGFLGIFFYGSSSFQVGLVASLRELAQTPGYRLTPAGVAALANSTRGIDDWVRYAVAGVSGGLYLALTILTFWNGWRKTSHIRVSDGN
ncbi:MAG: hypothetical protein SGJ21_05745 [Alphaproteobacteria bacterium]|nr:hypothetical protein [Alphaproteobacteria bacterium]